MNITTTELALQAHRALGEWPFIPTTEAAHGLPHCLLLAVGSRETNLTNERSFDGHGWGVWQLDDRSHQIPAGFAANVPAQALMAALMLATNIARSGLLGGINEYNSGSPDTAATTGGDYGPDVIERMQYLQTIIPVAPQGGIVPDLNPAWTAVSACSFEHPTYGTCAALVAPDGAVAAFPADAYCGGANGQDYFAGRRAATIKALAPFGYQIGDTGDPANPGKQEWYAFPPKA